MAKGQMRSNKEKKKPKAEHNKTLRAWDEISVTAGCRLELLDKAAGRPTCKGYFVPSP